MRPETTPDEPTDDPARSTTEDGPAPIEGTTSVVADAEALAAPRGRIADALRTVSDAANTDARSAFRIGDSVKQIAAYGIVFTLLALFLGLFMAGANLANNFWAAANSALLVQNTNLIDENRRKADELANVKVEYALYRQMYPSTAGSSATQLPTAAPVTPTLSTRSPVTTPPAPAAPPTQEQLPVTSYSMGEFPLPLETLIEERATIQTGQTSAVFGGDLYISLIAASFEGIPMRNKVFATIGSPGYDNITIDRGDVGYTVTYHGRGTFHIRVLTAGTISATFLVSRSAS